MSRSGPRVSVMVVIKPACIFGSGAAIGSRFIAEVRVEDGFWMTVTDGTDDDAAVNVASFSAGVRPWRAMEKRS